MAITLATATAKAEAAAEKAAEKPTPANIAAAAKWEAKVEVLTNNASATTKELNTAAKTAAAEVRQEISALRDQQSTEISILRQEAKADNIPPAQLRGMLADEKAANKTELSNYLTYAAQSIPAGQSTSLVSFFNPGVTMKEDGSLVDAQGNAVDSLKVSSSYIDAIANTDYGKAAADRLAAALGVQQGYNLQGLMRPDDNTVTGFSLKAIDKNIVAKEVGGEYLPNVVGKMLTRMDSIYDKVESGTGLTQDDLRFIKGNGTSIDKLKEVKGQDNIYRVRYGDTGGSDKNFVTEYYQKYTGENGETLYRPIETQKYKYDAPNQSGVLGTVATIANIASWIPQFAWLKPYAMTLSAMNAVDQGNIVGAITSALGLGNELGLTNFDLVDFATKEIVDATGLNFDTAKALTRGFIGAANNPNAPILAGVLSAGGSLVADALSKNDMGTFTKELNNMVNRGDISWEDAQKAFAAAETMYQNAGTLPINSTSIIDPGTSGATSYPVSDGGSGITSSSLQTGESIPTGVTSQPGTYGNMSVPTNGGLMTPDSGATTSVGYDTAGNRLPTGIPDGAQNIGNGFYTKDGTLYDSSTGQSQPMIGENDYTGGDPIQYGATDYGSGINIGTPSTWDNITEFFSGTSTGTLLGLPAGSWLSTGAGLIGDYITGDAAKDAAETLADEQAKIAQMMRFRPVGVTTRFGSSEFGYDKNGNLISAGYRLTPDVKAQQDRLMTQSGNYLTQYEGAKAATAPMGTTAAGLMTLGQNYLKTTPEEQAALYMKQQQALLDPANKAEYAALQNRLMQQGRLGLSTGGEGGLMASNPELAAYQNKLEMQQRQLAAAATKGGMDYANFGAGLVGSGGTMLQDMYKTQSAAYQPYNTALGGATQLEQLGKQAMDIGTSIGAQQSTANAQVGNMLNQSAQTQAGANAYSPWGTLLTGAGSAIGNLMQPQGQQIMYNPYTGARLI